MTRAPKACNAPGCPHEQPCPTHTPTRSPSSRVTGRRDWTKSRRRILKRQHVCHYCGKPADQIDHVKPVSDGGSNDASNLVAACADCNNRKGAR